MAQQVSIEPTGGPTGAEVYGVDLRQPVQDEVQDILRQAWADHQVLLFRSQELNDDHLTAVAEIFTHGAARVRSQVLHGC